MNIRRKGMVGMLTVDISEHKTVKDKFIERFGKDGFKIEQLGCFDCMDKLFPFTESACLTEDEAEVIIEAGLYPNKKLCIECDKRRYIRFADFSNDTRSFYYERKTVLDFIGSRRQRMYDQLTRMDTFIEGHKGLILEGMSEFVPLYDSYWKNINKKRLEKLSPIAQVVELGGKKEWTMSFIRGLKSRDMEFVQTWNLDETIDFLIQCDKGYGKTPKLRVIPKRYPDIPLEQNILVLFKGIGKQRSEKILKNIKIKRDLNKLIKDVRFLGYDQK